MTNELAETNLTPQPEAPLTKSEANQTPASQNNCQDYQADPQTLLYYCNACEYHCYRT